MDSCASAAIFDATLLHRVPDKSSLKSAAIWSLALSRDNTGATANTASFERSRSHGRRYACLLVEAFSSTRLHSRCRRSKVFGRCSTLDAQNRAQ